MAGNPTAYQFTHTVGRGAQLAVQMDKLQVEIVQLQKKSSAGGSVSYATPPPPPLPTPPSLQATCPPNVVRTLPNQMEIIAGARQQIETRVVSVNETRMTGPLQSKVLSIIIDSVQSEITFDAIAKRIRDRAGAAFGNYFTASVGTDSQFWSYFYISEPYFINLRIDRLRILLYRQIMYRVT